jgi:hypothetical protein
MRILLIALLASACTQPQPGPAPVPGPIADAAPAPVVDLFTGKVFDCHLDIVRTERDSAMPDVKGCLVAITTAHCLVTLAVQYQQDTVACVARDLGASANAAVLAGQDAATNKPIADAARFWIQAEGLGYK